MSLPDRFVGEGSQLYTCGNLELCVDQIPLISVKEFTCQASADFMEELFLFSNLYVMGWVPLQWPNQAAINSLTFVNESVGFETQKHRIT